MKIAPLTFRLGALATSFCMLVSCDKPEAAAPAVAPAAAPVQSAPPVAGAPAAAAAMPPADAVAESAGAPLDRFKEEIKAIKAFMVANEGSTDASVGLDNLKELVRRASQVKTEGIPEELASAYQGMISVMQRIETTLADLPVPVDQLQSYFEGETAKGGAAAAEMTAKMEAFKTSMEQLQTEGEAASTKLKEVGSRYGVESLDLSGK